MTKFYVSFELDQRGDSVAWIQHVLSSGIREGESINNFRIYDESKFNTDMHTLHEVKSIFADFIDLFDYAKDREMLESDKKLLSDFINYIARIRGAE